MSQMPAVLRLYRQGGRRHVFSQQDVTDGDCGDNSRKDAITRSKRHIARPDAKGRGALILHI